MKLHYKQFGEGQPLVIMHGLFGMLDNWQTLGKQWAENYHVILVDNRNHGHSPHAPDFNYEVMVDDLAELVDDLFLDDLYIIGHSMGGKIAMKFAQTYPELVQKLVVADIGPKHYPVHHQQIIAGLKSVDLTTVGSRGKVNAQLAPYIEDEGTRQFFLKNLYWREKGVLDWRFNLDTIAQNIENVGEDMLGNICNVPTQFIRGAKSNYILDEDFDAIKATFTQAELATVSNAGHWLHAENPSEFYEKVSAFLG
jgi:pimeloyl-ACP methyl ester carboxylesterase